MLIFRRVRFDLAVTAGCLLLLCYFAWHGWQGPRGFAHRDALAARLAELQQASTQVTSEKDALQARVMLMRPDHVDPDMVDELARTQLDMASANELILRQGKQ